MAEAVLQIDFGDLAPFIKPLKHPHTAQERGCLFRLSALVEYVTGGQDNGLKRIPTEQNREPLAGSEQCEMDQKFPLGTMIITVYHESAIQSIAISK